VISKKLRNISCVGLLTTRATVKRSPNNAHARVDSVIMPIIVRYLVEEYATLLNLCVTMIARITFSATLSASNNMGIIRIPSLVKPKAQRIEDTRPTTIRIPEAMLSTHN
jgi:hypothetical protein